MSAAARLDTLAGFVPGFVLAQLEAAGGTLALPSSETFPAAVLFADISGFTALTERLARLGPSGVEDVARIVNAYFERLVEGIAGHGGAVAKFAGDALLALWPCAERDLPDAVLRAAHAAVAVSAALAGFAASSEVALTVKLSVGAGPVTTAHLGGVRARCETAIAGPPLGQVGAANDVARPGWVVVSPEAAALVPAGRLAGAPLDGGRLRVDAVADPPAPAPLASRRPVPPGSEEAVLRYIPAAIRSRLEAGHQGWLAELRRITVLFASLARVDHETPLARAQTIVCSLQEAVYRFEGSVNKLSVDDKGTTFVAVFGLPPLAHEDDPARGARAAIAARARLRDLGVDCAIGLTTGRAFCGIVGGARRREYTIMGDAVNLAARLMQAAKDRGGILCDDATARAARERIAFAEVPALALKGKAEPVAAWRPLAVTETTGRFERLSRIVGREEERALRAGALDALRSPEAAQGASVVVLEGAPGMGKSRLAGTLPAPPQADLTVLAGKAESTERTTAYFAWRGVLADLLGLGGAAVRASADWRAAAQDAAAAAGVAGLAPLLEDVLPLRLLPSDLTADMTGEVRADNTRRLLASLVARAASTRPALLVLEDVHWLDSASWAALLSVARAARPLLVVLTLRPGPEPPPELARLLETPGARRLRLGRLSLEHAVALACRRLGVSSLPGELTSLLEERAQGNPYFCEEIADALRASGALEISEGECRLAPGGAARLRALIPDTIEGLITARIDRLAPAQQLAMKAASVIGTSFTERTVREIYPVPGERGRVPELLRGLDVSDFISREDGPGEPAHAFREAMAREVAYNLMPHEQRRALHRDVAESYEREHEGDLGPVLPALAHHWRQAGVLDRAVDCLARAGALALRSHANREAAELLTEALRLAAQRGDRDALTLAQWERQLGLALFSAGELEEGARHLRAALARLGAAAPESPFHVRLWFLGQALRQLVRRLLPGRFVGRAEGPAREARLEAARALERLGQVHFFAQEEEAAVACTVAALNAAERAGPSPELAQSYGTTCLAAGIVLSHAVARSYARRALAVAELVGRPATRAYVLQVTACYDAGLGAWEKARAALEEGAEIARRIGDGRRAEECTANVGVCLFLEGDERGGAARFEEVRRSAFLRDDPQSHVWGVLGVARLDLAEGRLERASELIEQARGLILGQGARLDRASEREVRALRALVRLRRGDPEGARALVEPLALYFAGNDVVTYYSAHVLAAVADVCLSLAEGGMDRARAGTPESVAGLERFARKFPISRPDALVARARLERLHGRQARAVRALERAAAEAERRGRAKVRVEALRLLGRAEPAAIGGPPSAG